MKIRLISPVIPLKGNQRKARKRQRKLLFGWAIVCNVDGQEHYDLEHTHIPEDEMFHAAIDFYQERRVGRVMHQVGLAGIVDFSLPLTKQVADIYGLPSSTTGWMIAWRPFEQSVIDDFEFGKLTGFSIGGEAFLEPSTRGHILRNLRIDEVSAVDNPGQPLAIAKLTTDLDRISTSLRLDLGEFVNNDR